MSSTAVLGSLYQCIARSAVILPRNFTKSIYSSQLRLRCTAAPNVNEGSKPSTEEKTDATASTEVAAEAAKKIEQLTADVADLKDKYQRTLADRENVRLRLEKQVADTKVFAIQGFCKDLLEVSDVFSKALETVTKQQLEEGPSELKILYDGLTMTQTQLHNVFKRHGLKSVEVKEGDKFDPGYQEAMFEVDATDAQKPGTVVHILRPGWKLQDRCLRSAQVGVVKH